MAYSKDDCQQLRPISYKKERKNRSEKIPSCLTEFQLREFYVTSELYNVQASVPSMLFHHVKHSIVFSRAVGCIFGELLNNSPLFPVSHYTTNLYNLFLVISCGCTVVILVSLSCSKNIHFSFCVEQHQRHCERLWLIIIAVTFPPRKVLKKLYSTGPPCAIS